MNILTIKVDNTVKINPTIAAVRIFLAVSACFSFPAELIYVMPPTINIIIKRTPAASKSIPKILLTSIFMSPRELAGVSQGNPFKIPLQTVVPQQFGESAKVMPGVNSMRIDA